MSEEEEEEVSGNGRPNLYWQQRRQEEGDTFSAAFRGVRSIPRKGSPVPEPIGSDEDCWCGLPAGHDWPGKSGGRKHPRKEAMMNAPALTPTILKKYDEDIAAVLKLAVEEYNCRYKVSRNSITVWGKNKSASPLTVGTNSGGSDIKKARSWVAKNVVGLDVEKKEVVNPMVRDPHVLIEDVEKKENARAKREDLEALAKALNGPEHPVETKEEAPEEATAEEVVEEWRPHQRAKGGFSDGYETNGTVVRCTRCGWVTENSRAIGGHERMVHRKEETRANTWGNPEVQAKKSDSLKANALKAKITQALEILAPAVDFASDDERVSELETEVARLLGDAVKHEAEVAALTKRAEEAEAKLALIKEAAGL